MPKWTKLLAGWAVAAVFAVALSWGAVAQVRNRVIQPSTPIPATSLATTETSAAPTVIRLDPATDESVTSSSDTPTTLLDPSLTGTTTTGAGGQPSAMTPTTTPPPSVTTSSTTTTTAPQTTTTTATTVAPAQTSSYQLLGGVVTISYTPDVVTFISAFPQSGYSTDIRDYGPDEVRVRFEGGDHTSDFRARWENGELQITKNETGD